MPIWLTAVSAEISWVILLASLQTRWRWLIRLTLITLILWMIPLFPTLELLQWGLVTAVPFATLTTLRTKTILPIIAPTAPATTLKPARLSGHITAEMIDTQQPILECLADGIIYFGRTNLIMAVNQAAAIILDTPVADMLGRPASNVLQSLPLFKTTSQNPINQFAFNGRTIRSNLNLIYDNEGAVQGTVIVLSDITAEYQAEKARDVFITTISHELRTPLTAIKGYVELLVDGTGGLLTEGQTMFMSIIQRNVTRVVDLINSLLFASSIKGGRLEYTSGHADLSQLIQQVSRELEATAVANQQTIDVELDARLKPIQADPIHLSTILQELVSNGIKYNLPQKKVTIRAYLQDDTAEQAFVVVDVIDEGIGIAPEDHPRVFDDFYRPEYRDEQVRTGGMGMGLSIVKALVEGYNGRIWFESKPDQGSKFTFIIPTKQFQASHMEAQSSYF
ncbi:MAG: hypothetical protein GY943_32975 [Chloroflexi bacterium]|nr:hypothetical protein [Chloroflexota bacterium]